MDDDTQMQAEHEKDMRLFEEQGRDALKASGERPLTPEEQACLAWLAGLGNTWRTENRT